MFKTDTLYFVMRTFVIFVICKCIFSSFCKTSFQAERFIMPQGNAIYSFMGKITSKHRFIFEIISGGSSAPLEPTQFIDYAATRVVLDVVITNLPDLSPYITTLPKRKELL